jgi:hypothetical protein
MAFASAIVGASPTRNRDPDICRGHDGRFYLAGNIRPNRDLSLGVSTNVVVWSKFKELRLDVSRFSGDRDNSGDHGAPKNLQGLRSHN